MAHHSCSPQSEYEAADHCSLDLTGTSTALQVHRQVQVAVMSTGDEVVDPATQELGPGQIRDANRSMLLAAASQAGAQVCAARCTRGADPAASGQGQGSPCMAITPCGQLLSLRLARRSGAPRAVLLLAAPASVQLSAACAASRVLQESRPAWRSVERERGREGGREGGRERQRQ